ncbi:hypothetical protein LX95_00074 [Mesonia algae]|uniref:ATP-grasp domain-containing protein n=1 Tax=Mesonia algae TaxID=213248 RepID=A0A2W7K842_9FLAO|nr:D-alanine--D-alanine ligase [Mesonia algae]PZW43750.1 hypothetical protein LX95_00074 [Mesonia algae]
MKLWWHKLNNWEYWPVYIVYLPTFFLWVTYMIKFRSFRFYNLVNPKIKNGGFYGDGKMEVYKLFPQKLYPKTLLISHIKTNNFEKLLKENQLAFPIIVKPDVGCRGVSVDKLYSLDALQTYHSTINEAYLIQENIELPNEIGLFYCRLPNQPKGQITGITNKRFLTVTGNGKDSLEQLLRLNPRFELQIPKLKNKIDLSEVLSNNEQRCLVPFGNHNRGTQFLDGKDLITEKLELYFDSVLSKIEGFYFGRLDIRFNTFEELEQGLNFSIIELNGVKSEPTHIYDPKYSFLLGQQEIFKHQKMISKIVEMNAVKSNLI